MIDFRHLPELAKKNVVFICGFCFAKASPLRKGYAYDGLRVFSCGKVEAGIRQLSYLWSYDTY